MTRTIFLETVAGVPGMVAGMLRHMKSLRSMSRDHGWHLNPVNGLKTSMGARTCRFMHRDVQLLPLPPFLSPAGWIHTLLEEAENERMHLMTFMQLKQPGPVFRNMVLLGQVILTLLQDGRPLRPVHLAVPLPPGCRNGCAVLVPALAASSRHALWLSRE